MFNATLFILFPLFNLFFIFRERFRTVMNIVGDSYVAAFVDKLCMNKPPQDTTRPQEYNLETIIHMHDDF